MIPIKNMQDISSRIWKFIEKERPVVLYLSILIATIEGRKARFFSLMEELDRQRGAFPPGYVEILSLSDNKEMNLGRKRNLLLEMAAGRYVVFIDDDDWIGPDYVKNILNAIVEEEPDCIGWLIDCEFRDLGGGLRKTARAICSNRYNGWQENNDGYDITQFIYHKNPVRREIALAVKFPEKNYGEDYPFGVGIKKYLKKETFIDEVMYYYRYQDEPGGHKERYGS